MKKWILAALLVMVIAMGAVWFSLDRDTRNLIAQMPTDDDVLFWTIPQRDAAFRAMDSLPILAQARIIDAGDKVFSLKQGDPLKVSTDIDAYMKAQRTAGIIVLHNGDILLEKYGLEYSGEGKWTSFSVAKSFTSTLVGAAIKDGHIKSIDDSVTDYIPDLKGSAYDDVTVKQLLTMTSGVRWNEDYTDPNSDVALFNKHTPDDGVDTTVSYMRGLPRDVPAGEKWVYNTGETNLIGVLVSSAVGKNLSQYLSEKIWAPFGMEQDGSWLLGATDHEIGGCCMQAALRDYARFGQFMLQGGAINDRSILPDGWIENATRKQTGIGEQGKGYGYQWWTYDDGSYAAQGIFGQGIFIDPARNLVVASNGNWPTPREKDGLAKQRDALYRDIQLSIDKGAAGI